MSRQTLATPGALDISSCQNLYTSDESSSDAPPHGLRSSMPPSHRQRVTRLSSTVLGVLLLGALAPTTATAAAAPTVLYASPIGFGSICSSIVPCSLTGARSKVQRLAAGMTADI